jgi:hypothetical protein
MPTIIRSAEQRRARLAADRPLTPSPKNSWSDVTSGLTLPQVLEESHNLRLNLRRIPQRGGLGILYGWSAIEQIACRRQRSGSYRAGPVELAV